MRDSHWLPMLLLCILGCGFAFGYIARDVFVPLLGWDSSGPIDIVTIPPGISETARTAAPTVTPSTTEAVRPVLPVSALTCPPPALLVKEPQELMVCLEGMDQQVADDYKQIDTVLPQEYDVDNDGQVDRQDFVLDGSGWVVLSSYSREDVFDVAQFDFDNDGMFDVAWFDMAPRDGFIDVGMYDVNGDGIADFARADVDFSRQFNPTEVFAYDWVDGRWRGAVPGAPSVLALTGDWPFFPLQFPFPFFYPG
jgi:hypothetical protein